jgi:hypothetical protein
MIKVDIKVKDDKYLGIEGVVHCGTPNGAMHYPF